MVITLCCMFTDDLKDLAYETMARNQKYCAKHNCNFLSQRLTETERPASWYKIPLIKKAFENGCDWAFYVDIDAWFLNFEKSVKDFLATDKDIVISRDVNGFNCGVMALRNCSYNQDLLDKLWEQDQFLDHIWWEQAAFQNFENENYNGLKDRIEIAPKEIFNAYYTDYTPESMLVHAVGQQDKLSHLKNLVLE